MSKLLPLQVVVAKAAVVATSHQNNKCIVTISWQAFNLIFPGVSPIKAVDKIVNFNGGITDDESMTKRNLHAFTRLLSIRFINKTQAASAGCRCPRRRRRRHIWMRNYFYDPDETDLKSNLAAVATITTKKEISSNRHPYALCCLPLPKRVGLIVSTKETIAVAVVVD